MSFTVHGDLITYQRIIWVPGPHGSWYGATLKLSPALPSVHCTCRHVASFRTGLTLLIYWAGLACMYLKHNSYRGRRHALMLSV